MTSSHSSVVQPWLSALTLRQQSVILLACRGCGGLPKEDLSKPYVRHYRSFVLKQAGPDGNFQQKWPPPLEKTFFEALDHYPVHWLMHFLHGTQILGYKHPSTDARLYWSTFYTRATEALHFNVETEPQNDLRLKDRSCE